MELKKDDPTIHFWRTGRSVYRTIYVIYPDGEEELIGMMDTKDLADSVVYFHNEYVSKLPKRIKELFNE